MRPRDLWTSSLPLFVSHCPAQTGFRFHVIWLLHVSNQSVSRVHWVMTPGCNNSGDIFVSKDVNTTSQPYVMITLTRCNNKPFQDICIIISHTNIRYTDSNAILSNCIIFKPPSSINIIQGPYS